MPTSPIQVQQLLVKLGKAAWEDDYGESLEGKAVGHWSAELGYTAEHLDMLAENGVQFIFAGRDQIDSQFDAPIYIHTTSTGKSLIVYPFNKTLHHQMAHGELGSSDQFADSVQSFGRPGGTSEMIVTDLETVRHHREEMGYHMDHLINNVVPQRVAEGNMNYKRRVQEIRPGHVKTSAWSCPHTHDFTNFPRWTGEGNHCKCHGENAELNAHKKRVYEKARGHMDRVLGALNQLPPNSNGIGWEEDFIQWFLTQRFNLVAGREVQFDGIQEDRQEHFRQFLMSLFINQSCEFFFDGEYERELSIEGSKYLDSRAHLLNPPDLPQAA